MKINEMKEKKFEEGKVYLFNKNYGDGFDGGKIQYRIRIVKKTDKSIKVAVSWRDLEIYGAVCDNVEDQKFSEEKITGAKKLKKYKDDEYFVYDDYRFFAKYSEEAK